MYWHSCYNTCVRLNKGKQQSTLQFNLEEGAEIHSVKKESRLVYRACDCNRAKAVKRTLLKKLLKRCLLTAFFVKSAKDTRDI